MGALSLVLIRMGKYSAICSGPQWFGAVPLLTFSNTLPKRSSQRGKAPSPSSPCRRWCTGMHGEPSAFGADERQLEDR
jgi:hypothetical protein